jgi:hypothetical protein
MLIIEFIRKRDERFIPAVIASFLSAKQQNCRSSRVKGVKNPVWLSLVGAMNEPSVKAAQWSDRELSFASR